MPSARAAPRRPTAPSLRGRLSGLVIAALLPFAILMSALAYAGYRAERDRAEARAVDLARGVALAVERELRGMTASLEALALSPSLAADDLDAFRREATALVGRHYPGANVLLVAADGQQRMNLRVPEGQQLPVRAAMDTTRQVLATGRPAVSDVYEGQSVGRPVVSVDVPVRAPDGQVTQVLSLGPPLSLFADIIRQQRPRSGSVVGVMDRRGTIIAREPDPEGRFAGRPAVAAFVAEVQARGEGTMATTTLDGAPVLSAFSRPGPSGWSTAIGTPRGEILAPFWRSLAITGAAASFTLLLALLLARAVARRIARPIRALVDLAAAPGRDAPSSLGLREADAVAAALLAAERARAETEERYRLVVESAEIGFWDVDPVNDAMVWPPRVKAMFGISPDAPVTMADFHAGLHPEDREATAAAYAAATDPARRAFYDVEYRTIGKEDGVLRWVSAKGRGLFDGSGRCVRVIGAAVDITARKAAEAALARGEAELRRLNEGLEARVRQEVAAREQAQARLAHTRRMEALGQLAGGVAHDFNNVLQAVQGGARLIEGRPDEPDRVRRLAHMVAEAAGRGAAVTRRLLAFSRRADLRAEPVDVASLLSGLDELLVHTLGGGIAVRTQARPGLPPLLADKAQLETVLVNLATNARDAMEGAGTITLSAATESVAAGAPAPGRPVTLRPGRYLRLSLSDTGAGMDAATLARATEPFFTTKEIGKGTGLGLAMARGFAEQSDGALAIESAPRAGTTVHLWLPVAEAARPFADDPRPATPSRARVMLVDDESLVRAITAEGLEAAGYAVLSLGSGAEALEALDAGEAVEALVSDLSMPGMDGLALIRAAQARRPGLPAVLLTGLATDTAELAMGGALSGSFSLLRKPAEAQALAERVATLLKPGEGLMTAGHGSPGASGPGPDGA